MASRLREILTRIAFRFWRWREDQETWEELKHLDHRQLKEFGIYPRPPDLVKCKFPEGSKTAITARQEVQMITAITTFILPNPIAREEARDIFLSTAPNYRGVQGLLRKTYVLSEDRVTLGGIYLWSSRPEAEAMYTDSWRSFVRKKYGTEPTVAYFESPVVVDNVTQQILTDEQENLQRPPALRANVT